MVSDFVIPALLRQKLPCVTLNAYQHRLTRQPVLVDERLTVFDSISLPAHPRASREMPPENGLPSKGRRPGGRQKVMHPKFPRPRNRTHKSGRESTHHARRN